MPASPLLIKPSSAPALKPAEEPFGPKLEEKPQGRCACCRRGGSQEQGCSVPWLPTSTSPCESRSLNSCSRRPGRPLRVLYGPRGAGEHALGLAWPSEPACAEPNSVFIAAPAASASFLPVLLPFWRRPAGPSVPRAGRGVKDVRGGDRKQRLCFSPARPTASEPLVSPAPRTPPRRPHRLQAPTHTQAPTCSHFLSPSDLPPSLATSIPAHGADPGPSHLFFSICPSLPNSLSLSLSPFPSPARAPGSAIPVRSALPLPPPLPKKKKKGAFSCQFGAVGRSPASSRLGSSPPARTQRGEGCRDRGGCSRGWHCGVPPGFGSHRRLQGGPPWGPAHPSTRVVAAPHPQESCPGKRGRILGPCPSRGEVREGLEATLESIRGGRHPGGHGEGSVPGRGGRGGEAGTRSRRPGWCRT